ncbi:hypothetical protein GCM10029964_026720 [Kibdelosporangium lantanae]
MQVGKHTEATDPVERTVLADARRYGRRSIAILTDRLAGSDAVQEVAASLVRVGYLVDAGKADRRRLVGLVPMAVVLAVGVVRLFAGMANDRPVGYLILLLVATGLVLHLLRRLPIDRRTFQGEQAAKAVQVGDSPAECVATSGFAGHPDEAVRDSLAIAPARAGSRWTLRSRPADAVSGPWLSRAGTGGSSYGVYGAGTFSSGVVGAAAAGRRLRRLVSRPGVFGFAHRTHQPRAGRLVVVYVHRP